MSLLTQSCVTRNATVLPNGGSCRMVDIAFGSSLFFHYSANSPPFGNDFESESKSKNKNKIIFEADFHVVVYYIICY